MLFHEEARMQKRNEKYCARKDKTCNLEGKRDARRLWRTKRKCQVCSCKLRDRYYEEDHRQRSRVPEAPSVVSCCAITIKRRDPKPSQTKSARRTRSGRETFPEISTHTDVTTRLQINLLVCFVLSFFVVVFLRFPPGVKAF